MSEIISTDPIKNIKIFEGVVHDSYPSIEKGNGLIYPAIVHTLEAKTISGQRKLVDSIKHFGVLLFT